MDFGGMCYRVIFLLLIGAKMIVSLVEFVLLIVIEAFSKKHYPVYILFLFSSLAELLILDGWIQILLPVIYETKETMIPAMRLGIEFLEFTVLILLKCWGWKMFWRKTFTEETSLDQGQGSD